MSMVRPEYLAVSLLIALLVARPQPAQGTPAPGWPVPASSPRRWSWSLAPWAVRNALVLDRFVPISTGGSQVLFAGTYLPSDGDPQAVGGEVLERNPAVRRRLAKLHPSPLTGATTPRLLLSQRVPPVEVGPRELLSQRIFRLESISLERILATLAAQRHPGEESDTALAQMGRAQLWHDIRDQPLRTAGFAARKMTRIWVRGQRDVMEEPGWAVFHVIVVALALWRPGAAGAAPPLGGAPDRLDLPRYHAGQRRARRLAAAGAGADAAGRGACRLRRGRARRSGAAIARAGRRPAPRDHLA